MQSAVCAAFLGAGKHVHIPVNVRPFLTRNVGESVGLFIGAAEIRMRYKPGRGLWATRAASTTVCAEPSASPSRSTSSSRRPCRSE